MAAKYTQFRISFILALPAKNMKAQGTANWPDSWNTLQNLGIKEIACSTTRSLRTKK